MFKTQDQPLRGFKYSEIVNDGRIIRKDPKNIKNLEFESFQQLFDFKIDYCQNITYLFDTSNNKSVKVTYQSHKNKIIELKSKVKNTNGILVIYSDHNYYTHLLLDFAQYYNIPIIVSSPQYQTVEEFRDSLGHLKHNTKHIYCDKDSLDNLKKLFNNSNVHEINRQLVSSGDIQLSIDENIEVDKQIYLKNNITHVDIKKLYMNLESWSHAMNLCRDSKVVNMFPLGSNIERLIRYLCIYNKTSCANTIDEFQNPTHLFATKDFYENLEKSIKLNLSNISWFKSIIKNSLIFWNYFKLFTGSRSDLAHKIILDEVFPKELPRSVFYMFCNEQLCENVHKYLTKHLSLPTSLILCDDRFANYGFCHPPDPRFTKYGTFGGPIGCGAVISGDELILNDDIKVNINVFWDRESCIVMKAG